MLSSKLRWVGLVAALLVGLAFVACASDEPQVQPQPQVESQAESRQTQAEPQPERQSEPQQSEPQAQPQRERQDQTAAQARQSAAQDAQSDPTDEQQEQQVVAAEQPQEADQSQAQAEAEQASPEGRNSQALTQALAGVGNIVAPGNLGWPREVEGLNGIVVIPAQPMRIITASIGHDEIVLALVPSERLIAVGAVSKDATFSNVADLVLDKPEVSRDPETIIVQTPDLVVTSPYYPVEGIDALRRAGLLVVQTPLDLDPQSQINNILLIGYILGEEERALAFAEEVQARLQTVLDATTDKTDRPGVISLTKYGDSMWTAGSGSTQGSLIEAAGGVNAAAAAGIAGNQTVGLESVIAMAPDVIIIPQPAAYGAEEFRERLFNDEALAEVPAILNDAVYIVDSKHFTTLSHWNVLGAESLARILWPDDFPDPPAATFSPAE